MSICNSAEENVCTSSYDGYNASVIVLFQVEIKRNRLHVTCSKKDRLTVLSENVNSINLYEGYIHLTVLFQHCQ